MGAVSAIRAAQASSTLPVSLGGADGLWAKGRRRASPPNKCCPSSPSVVRPHLLPLARPSLPS